MERLIDKAVALIALLLLAPLLVAIGIVVERECGREALGFFISRLGLDALDQLGGVASGHSSLTGLRPRAA